MASRFDVTLYRSGCAAQHSGHLVSLSAHFFPFFPVSTPPVVLATTAVLAHRFFFLPSRLDTIGLDSMNELASATRARCVESSLIKGSSLLCRHLIHMHMLFLVSCLIFFCSRSRVFFISPPFHSVRAVGPWIDISLFALFVLCYCPCSILLLLAIVPFRFQGK